MHLVNDLKYKKCVRIQNDVKPLTSDEYGEFLRENLIGWNDFEEKRIEKEYTFKNFKKALDFINKVGALAEEEGHHPDMLLYGWNKVRVMLTTHAIGGLSENDFILASKIDMVQSD